MARKPPDKPVIPEAQEGGGFARSLEMLEVLGAVRAVVEADAREAAKPILLDGVAPREGERVNATFEETPSPERQVRKRAKERACALAERPPSRRRSRSELAVREEDSAREKTLPKKRPYGRMSPATKRTFLQALSRTGNVRGSAHYAGISHEAAYQTRRRDAAFACAWDGALVIARDMAQDELTDKAMNGITEDIIYHGEVTASRTRFDGRLLLALLARLDKHAADNPAALRGAARFDALLERIGAGVAADDLITTPVPAEEPWRYGEGGRGAAVGAVDPALKSWLEAEGQDGAQYPQKSASRA